jgi:Uma2 family endonuclease
MPTHEVHHESWVRQTPGVCGGEPCIRETRYTVSGLVQWRSLGLSDAESHRRDHPGAILRIGHGSEVRYVIPEIRSGRHPDVAVVVRGDPRDAKGRLRPSLAVEVVSPGKRSRKRDYEDKKADYLALDIIRESWIVDPIERQVTVLLRRGAGPDATRDEQVFQGEQAIRSDRLPGLAMTASDLWAEVDG